MLSEEIIAKVNEAIADEFEVDPEELTPESHLSEDLGLDSLDSVDMIAAMQRTFKVKIPEQEARSLQTLGDIYVFVEKLMAEQNQPPSTPDAGSS